MAATLGAISVGIGCVIARAVDHGERVRVRPASDARSPSTLAGIAPIVDATPAAPGEQSRNSVIVSTRAIDDGGIDAPVHTFDGYDVVPSCDHAWSCNLVLERGAERTPLTVGARDVRVFRPRLALLPRAPS